MKNKQYRSWSLLLIVAMVFLGWFIFASETTTTGFISRFPFKLGLDLAGGTELIYKVDTSKVIPDDVEDSLNSLKEVIERRVNLFGVSEAVVQIEGAGAFSQDNKLIVDLPGVTDIDQAIELIGKTPSLEFKLAKTVGTSTEFISTGLTGRFIKRATFEFTQGTSPTVGIQFTSEGADLFAQITRENISGHLGIFLDDVPISIPVINEEITGGQAQISGNFSPEEARTLVRDLNYGALPVPIELAGTQTIGPSLGASALHSGVNAGLWGFAFIALFLILWYRLPGLIAAIALVMYIVLSLVAFKVFSITLTAAGLAGFILSIGMAVDANILIFERMKEELKRGKNLTDSIHEGFHRAWLSIRDSNISSIITALVLFWLGTASVKGFAMTLGLGVLISMFTAITFSRTLLFALPQKGESKASHFLFGSGTSSANPK